MRQVDKNIQVILDDLKKEVAAFSEGLFSSEAIARLQAALKTERNRALDGLKKNFHVISNDDGTLTIKPLSLPVESIKWAIDVKLENPFLHPIEDGQLLTLEQFSNDVRNCCLIDADGSGYYATETHYAHTLPAVPSTYEETLELAKEKGATHVLWFNK